MPSNTTVELRIGAGHNTLFLCLFFCVPSQTAFGSAAEALESAHSEVLAAIRERYSAETLWSDKIRRASTWWTAGLMGLHLASFLVGVG